MDEIIDQEILNFNHDKFAIMKSILSEIQKMIKDEYIKYEEFKEINKQDHNDVICDLLSSLLEKYHNNCTKLFYEMKKFIDEQLKIFDISKIINIISYYENLKKNIVDDMKKLSESKFIRNNFVLNIYREQKIKYHNIITFCIYRFIIMLKLLQSEDFS